MAIPEISCPNPDIRMHTLRWDVHLLRKWLFGDYLKTILPSKTSYKLCANVHINIIVYKEKYNFCGLTCSADPICLEAIP